ncbi:hypothetical protein [Micromonospora sp. NPDC049497]|uniref:hypothetical protein n=1 Tax=Micromonospora sp. NPDC049497 TaxID=3364273 RepID=UPI00379C8A04
MGRATVAVSEPTPLPSFRSHAMPERVTLPGVRGAQRDNLQRGDIAVSERTRADHRGAAVSERTPAGTAGVPARVRRLESAPVTAHGDGPPG